MGKRKDPADLTGRRCAYCGQPLHRSGTRYCSRRCAGLARQHYRECAVCGKPFSCAPSADTRTCSPACSAELRRRKAKSLSQWPKFLVSREEYQQNLSPEEQPRSKGWTLRAPDGAVYECRNLLAFFRANPDLISTSPETAARGIVVIKCSLTGSRKRNKTTQWRGWTLLDWDDRVGAENHDPTPPE